MRCCFFVIAGLLGGLVIAQPATPLYMGSMPMKDGKVCYEAVIPVDSVSASQIYKRLKAFVFDSFRSGKDVIQQDDSVARQLRTAGTIQCYWQNSITTTFEVNLWHHLAISVRDGRFKYTITDFRVQMLLPQYKAPSKSVDDPLEQWNTERPKNLVNACAGFHANILAFIEGMVAAARAPGTAEEDW